MKNTSKSLIVALALFQAILFSTTALADSKESSEEASKTTPSTYEQEIAQVLAQKLVTDKPTSEANKCEVLQMLARKFDWTLSTLDTTVFTDVPGWCIPLTNTARELGVVKGRTDTLLGLDTPVTRNEVATMLYRELNNQDYLFSSTGATTSFSDTIPDWAGEAVKALSKEGIIKGFDNGTFGGESGILKQDLGVMLIRLDRDNTSNTSDQDSKEESNDNLDKNDKENTNNVLDNNLVGSWIWQKTEEDGAIWKEASSSEFPFIVNFTKENRLSVKGDCNAISGRFSQPEIGKIKIAELVMTKMLCDGSIENGFVLTLNKADKYKITQNSLVIQTTSSETSFARTMYFVKEGSKSSEETDNKNTNDEDTENKDTNKEDTKNQDNED